MTTTTAWSSYVTLWPCRQVSAFWKKRFVDVTLRYGVHPFTVDRWKKKFCSSRRSLRKKAGCSIYELLPGVVENSFRQEESHV